MRRWTLLVAGAALWLFLAAIPALADGGPHAYKTNNGSSTLTADSCAGCHRAHTAQAAMLLKTAEEDLCLTCHGTGGTGATVNVEDGVQYSSAATSTGAAGAVSGALRGGGFVFARISSTGGNTATQITRVPYPRDEDRNTAGTQLAVSFSSQVKALSDGLAITSAHMHIGDSAFEERGVAWGNGATGVGPTVDLECGSCHNPHGNGLYRILQPIPSPAETGGSSFTDAAQKIFVNEVRTDPAEATGATTAAEKTRNYTIQWGATLDDVTGAKAYPPSTSASASLGDYWRLYQPYNVVPTWDGNLNNTPATPVNAYSGDMPEFIPPSGTLNGTPNARTATQVTNGAGSVAAGQSVRWRQQMTAWCSTCHSRYNTQQAGAGSTPVTTTDPIDNTSTNLPGGTLAPSAGYPTGFGSYNTDSGDGIYKYRHGTQNRQCTMCHVAHGSNALMNGQGATAESADYPYPGGTVSNASSRLLKVDNRGTCQQCHDPTKTIKYNDPAISH